MRTKASLTVFLIASFSFSQTMSQLPNTVGNPAIIKKGYTFVVRAPNDPATKSITGSDFIDVYFRPLEGQKSGEVLQIYMPAPSNAMPQIAARVFDLSCANGSARFKSLTTYDGQWTKQTGPREMLGSKWEIPAENTLAYIALKLSCP